MCERCEPAARWPWPPRAIESELRNASVRSRWRSPLGARDRGAWAPWVDELSESRGVYLIRDAASKELLYVGESHRGARLKKTLTRHFWNWEGRGAGPTYPAALVEVAVELYDDPNETVERQYELIRALHPRDNVTDGHTLFRTPPADADDVPF